MPEAPTEFAIILAVTDEELDHAIDHLRHLNKQYSIAYAIETADYLVKIFYQGDYALARDRDPHKHAAFEELLERRQKELAEIDLTPRTLRRYIAAGDVWHGLPEKTREQLGVAHLEKLAAVQDVKERKQLAHNAATMHWTREQTAKAVKDLKKKERGGKKKPGRKVKPKAVKAVVALKHAIGQVQKLHYEAKKKLAEGPLQEYWTTLGECRKLLLALN